MNQATQNHVAILEAQAMKETDKARRERLAHKALCIMAREGKRSIYAPRLKRSHA